MNDLRILVIDADNAIHATLIGLLGAEGCEVVAVHDGAMAAKLVRQNPPDAILLDLGLPGESGYRTLHRLRELPETLHTPVIVISEREDVTEDEACRQGADGFLRKPLDGNQLLNLLLSLVEPEARAA